MLAYVTTEETGTYYNTDINRCVDFIIGDGLFKQMLIINQTSQVAIPLGLGKDLEDSQEI